MDRSLKSLGAGGVSLSWRRMSVGQALIAVASYVGLGLGLVIMVAPFVWMVFSSFKSRAELFYFPPRWLPRTWLWQNYVEVFHSFPFFNFIGNSFKVSVLSTIGQVLTCSMAAYCFARFTFPGRDLLFIILLSTMMVPGQVTMIPVFLIMRAFGWVDTHYPLIVPSFFGGAFGTFLLRQFFLTIPFELEDAARIDGATRFGIYWRIFLPLGKPALATLALLAFMNNWNNLLGPVIYLQTRSKMTLAVGLALFRGMYSTDYALLMAGSLISVIPLLILYALAQQYFVQGVTMTGIKG